MLESDFQSRIGVTQVPRHRYDFVIDHPDYIYSWIMNEYKLFPQHYNLCVGIIDREQGGILVGGFYFSNFSGYDIEFSLYAPDTVKLGMLRAMATIACSYFNVIRVTIKTSERNYKVIKGAKKFGFEVEGIQKDFYGRGTNVVRFVMFRGQLEKIAGHRLKMISH